jgi:hypothetical protein
MLGGSKLLCRVPLALVLVSATGCDNSSSMGTDGGNGSVSNGLDGGESIGSDGGAAGEADADAEGGADADGEGGAHIDMDAARGSGRSCPALTATASPDIDLSQLPTCDSSNQGQLCPGFERYVVCVDGFWLLCERWSPWGGCYVDGHPVDTCNNKSFETVVFGDADVFPWCQNGMALPPGTLCCHDPDASFVGWVATPDAGCSGTCSPSCVNYHLTYPDTCPQGDAGGADSFDAGSDSATDAPPDAMDSGRE